MSDATDAEKFRLLRQQGMGCVQREKIINSCNKGGACDERPIRCKEGLEAQTSDMLPCSTKGPVQNIQHELLEYHEKRISRSTVYT